MQNEMNLIPLNHRVLVEIPKDTSGVYIPQATSDSQQEGIVVAIAAGIQGSVQSSDLIVKAGDRVRWERYAESDGQFEYQGKQCVLLEFMRITGVYREGKR